MYMPRHTNIEDVVAEYTPRALMFVSDRFYGILELELLRPSVAEFENLVLSRYVLFSEGYRGAG
jgi:hypothetical protein